MNKEVILEKLDTLFKEIISIGESVSPAHLFAKDAADKWSIAENIHHLSLTYMPINASARSPKTITEKWGLSGRTSRSYEDLLEAYKQATSAYAWKTFPPFVPKRADQNEAYVKLHATDSKERVDDFYKMVGETIQTLTEKVPLDEKDPGALIKTFRLQSRLLIQSATKLAEEQLDSLQIPLPYLGLITFKESLYFNHFHTNHHLNSVKDLSKKDFALA